MQSLSRALRFNGIPGGMKRFSAINISNGLSKYANLGRNQALLESSIGTNAQLTRGYAANNVNSGKVKTEFEKEDEAAIPSNVRKEYYDEYIDFMNNISRKDLTKAIVKKSKLNTMLQSARTNEEFELAMKFYKRWRKFYTLPLSEKTTWILLTRCQYFKNPDPLIKALLDKWEYKPFPTGYIYTNTFKLISTQIASIVEAEGQESETANKYLDDLFRIFGTLPAYNMKADRFMYSALIQACINSNMELGWERAVVTAEEAFEVNGNMPLNFEAAVLLKEGYEKRGDLEAAKVYADYISKNDIKPSESYHVDFDENGNMLYKLQPKLAKATA